MARSKLARKDWCLLAKNALISFALRVAVSLKHTFSLVLLLRLIMLAAQTCPLRELVLTGRGSHLAVEADDIFAEGGETAIALGLWYWKFGEETP